MVVQEVGHFIADDGQVLIAPGYLSEGVETGGAGQVSLVHLHGEENGVAVGKTLIPENSVRRHLDVFDIAGPGRTRPR
jgi:hypothetical protein